MSVLAGIDLGTTYSALAILNDAGEPEIVPTFSGDRIMPSVVAFNRNGSICVGQEAKNRLSEDPENVVQFVKRKMGVPGHTYSVVGKTFSPVDISAMILRKLKEECSSEGDIRDVVITVPAAFTEIERKSTMDAGAIAGLNVLAIVNEPTAAAIFYGKQTEVSGNVLVYDLGGGTFDVTILKLNGSNIQVLTSKGDVQLGGVDFDHAIIKIVNDFAKNSSGKGFFSDEFITTWDESTISTSDRAFFFKLMKKAEQLKKSLSSRPKATINFVTPSGENFSKEITREEFEEEISPFISQTEMLVENALEDANLSRSDMNKILFVGGSTRVPAIQKSIERIFKKSAERAVNVDEAVALGAAIYSAMSKIETSGLHSVPAIIKRNLPQNVVDVCNANFGTVILRNGFATFVEMLSKRGVDSEEDLSAEDYREINKNSIILKKNTRLPCSFSDTFCTARDNQTGVCLKITECQEATDDPTLVNIIGEVNIELNRGVPENTPINVTYEYDKNQRLHVHVECDGVEKEVDICYFAVGTLSQQDLKRKCLQLEEFEIVEE